MMRLLFASVAQRTKRQLPLIWKMGPVVRDAISVGQRTPPEGRVGVAVHLAGEDDDLDPVA